MNSASFDRLTHSVSTLLSRRRLARAFGLGALVLPGLVEAGNKHRRRHKKKVKRNEFGCVNVDHFCKNDSQCCSGICRGKKGKKKCKAHNASTCRAGQLESFCGGVDVDCTTTGGAGVCDTTTGNAAYCTYDGNCFACAKDADCVPFCGPDAACVPCVASCPVEGTACFGPGLEGGESSCNFPA